MKFPKSETMLEKGSSLCLWLSDSHFVYICLCLPSTFPSLPLSLLTWLSLRSFRFYFITLVFSPTFFLHFLTSLSRSFPYFFTLIFPCTFFLYIFSHLNFHSAISSPIFSICYLTLFSLNLSDFTFSLYFISTILFFVFSLHFFALISLTIFLSSFSFYILLQLSHSSFSPFPIYFLTSHSIFLSTFSFDFLIYFLLHSHSLFS